MGLGFLKHSGLVGEGDPFEDVHGAEQPHPVVLPLNQTQVCAHHTQLGTWRPNIISSCRSTHIYQDHLKSMCSADQDSPLQPRQRPATRRPGRAAAPATSSSSSVCPPECVSVSCTHLLLLLIAAADLVSATAQGYRSPSARRPDLELVSTQVNRRF